MKSALPIEIENDRKGISKEIVRFSFSFTFANVSHIDNQHEGNSIPISMTKSYLVVHYKTKFAAKVIFQFGLIKFVLTLGIIKHERRQ